MKNSYKLMTKILLTIFVLLHVSCSWLGVRDPAANKQEPTISIDDVFSISASKELSKKDFKEQFMSPANLQSKAKIVFVEQLSKDLPPDTAFKLELDVVDNQYVYRILHSKDAFKDLGAVYELGAFISKTVNYTSKVGHPLSVYEMYYNAKEGDPIALDNFLKIKANREIPYYSMAPEYTDALKAADAERVEAVQEMRTALAPQIKELKQERKVFAEKRKALMEKLDQAPEAKQFKALVAKNDRAGVADLLKKYLPWEEMAPYEKRFWETHLEVLRNPVPLDQRVLIYRGLDDDFIHVAQEGGKELDKEEAMKESKVFVMSTLLVKNQGTWNRRLRSLTAMNEKFIGTINNSSEFAQSERISTLFMQHAVNPQGSPLLSFTPKLGVAQNFGRQKIMSALLDPRMIHFNYVSNFDNEIEFLMPLVTFPDDMVGFWSSHELYESMDPKFMETHLTQRIEDEFGKSKAPAIIQRIKKNTADFFSPVFNNNQPKMTKVEGGTMENFYKKFAKVSPVKASMDTRGDLSCNHLVKFFWTVP